MAKAGLEPEFRNLLDERFAPPVAPAPPSRISADAGNGTADIAWSPSIFDGGSPVASYTVTSSRGDHATISADDFRRHGYLALSGLSNGTAYTFAVTAANASGTSAPSLPSLSVTPSAKAIEVPPAPARIQVWARDGKASVHFQAPASDGGSPVTAYVFTVNPGGRSVVCEGRSVLVLSGAHETFDVIDELPTGQTCTIAVAATNAAGTGPAMTSKPFVVVP